MALQCQMSLNVAAYTAGQSPSPQATLQVYNPNASSVAVTGISLTFADAVTGTPINISGVPSTPAMGPGQTVVAPALSSINFGPFPIAIGSGAAQSLFLAQPSGTQLRSPANIQLGMTPQYQLQIGAVVYGSDGSVNSAGTVALMVAYAVPPPVGFQGGSLQFTNINNTITGLIMGVL